MQIQFGGSLYGFVNIADEPFRLVAVFSTGNYTFEAVGPNSILVESG